MVPFRVFDRENKITWIVLNYHPGQNGGQYLVAREDDSNQDGEMSVLSADEISKYRLVDFYEEQE
mgnify:CR=1 FL=1